MYTIKQAAMRSGVDASLIRAWERRYGVTRPERTPGGYRLYSDDEIARLRAMRELIERGWSAAQAATAAASAGIDRGRSRDPVSRIVTGTTGPRRCGSAL